MSTGLRERKKERTRQQLADAALELFEQKGFACTTIEDIADACDVSVRTFFRYYGGKEDVLFAHGDEKLERLRAALVARPREEPPFEAVRMAVREMAAGYTDDRERMVRRHRILQSDEHLRNRAAERQASWEEALAAALKERTRKAIPPMELALIVGTATTALRVASKTWTDAGGRGDFGRYIDAAFDRLAEGFGTGHRR